MGAVALSGGNDHCPGLRITHDQARASLGVWMTVVAAIAMLGSLGHFTSPIWLSRALAVASSSTALRNWLPDLGPLDTVESMSIRTDGRLHDSDGSAYWWLSTLLPGFRQFRYPAKLFTFVALALAVLAGFGWDRLGKERSRAVTALFLTLLILTSTALAVRGFSPRADPRFASRSYKSLVVRAV